MIAKTGGIVVKADRLTSGVKLTISAQAEEDVKIDYTLQTYGDTEDVTVTQDAGSMTISQTAESASMVGNKGQAGEKCFLHFIPTVERSGKNDVEIKGQFLAMENIPACMAGAFQPDGDYLYNSIGFRGTGDVNAVSPYWLKASGKLETEVRSRHGQKGCLYGKH